MKKSKKLSIMLLCLVCMLTMCVTSVFAFADDAGTTEPGTTEPGTTEPGTTEAEPGTWEWEPTDKPYLAADREGFNNATMSLATGSDSGGVFMVKWNISTSAHPLAEGQESTTFNNHNGTQVNLVEGVAQYLYFNGQKYADLDKSTYTFSFHLMNVGFNCHPDGGYKFKAGDTFEFRRGMYFPLVGTGFDKFLHYSYEARLGETLAVEYTGTNWITSVPSGSEASLSSVSAITAVEASMVFPEAYTFTASFNIRMANSATDNLEEDDAYSEKISINGKTVKEWNQTKVMNESEEEVSPIIISSNASAITFTIARSANIVSPTSAVSITFDSTFVSKSGMVLGESINRYYSPFFEYWSSVEPWETPLEGLNPVNINSVIRGGDANEVKRIDIIFKENIMSGAVIPYGTHPGQAQKPNIADAMVASGALENFATHILINDSTIKELWDGASSVSATWQVLESYVRAANNLSFSSSHLEKANAYTIVLKKGLLFQSGAYLDHDVTITHAANADEATYTSAAKSATLTADTTDIEIGDQIQLEYAVSPADATDERTFVSSDTSVLTVSESGLVTAVGKGTATVKVKYGNVESEAVTFTVVPALTGISVDSTLSIEAGKTAKITVTAQPEGAVANCTFESNNEAVTTVAADGTVTAVAEGTAKITVTCGDFSKEVTVTVTKAQTGEPTTPGGNEPTTPGGEEPAKTEKKKCGSQLGATAGIIGMLMLCGAAILVARRKQSA